MSLYQDHILDHFHNPRHQGTLVNPTHTSDAKNISCGDSLHMDIIIRDDIIEDIGFSGSGCAISQASASLLAEYVYHKSVGEVLQLKTNDILAIFGIEFSPNRLKCALLSLETLHKSLNNKL
jgi:nitrogen fixation NifU-like protein